MRVGILGGGQLGRMLALAGYPLGIQCRVLDPSPDACAGQVAEHVAVAFDSERALERFSHGLQVATFEWENVPVEAARRLARKLPFFPSPEALATAQDRLLEKTLFRKLGIPTAPFVPVDSREGLAEAVKCLGLPVVLKTRRLGYDGKGQYVLREPADEDRAWKQLGGSPLVLEDYVDFQRELSIIAVRGSRGDTSFYPLVENHHREGILRLSLAPAPGLTPALQAQAEDIARRVLDDLDYVGVLVIEVFEADGRLLANEMATRVHNSGHWTIEGAQTSQFENHLRAICALPIGSTASAGHAAMINVIGASPEPASILAFEGAHLHLYGKAPRPGRKLGHVTVVRQDEGELSEAVDRLRGLVESVSA